MHDQQNRLTLAFISRNSERDLRCALNSLLSRIDIGSIDVVLVDNDSSDRTLEMAEQSGVGIKIIEMGRNAGYSASCNRALEETDTDYVIVLNCDILFLSESKALEELISFMDVNPEIGAVGVGILNIDGSRQMSCRRVPSVLESAVHGFLGKIYPRNRLTAKYLMADNGFYCCSVEWVSGAAMAIRRSAWQQIGGFDEDFFMYVEDVDFCKRLRNVGWKVFFYPSFEVIHEIAGSSSGSRVKMLYEHHRSMLIFFKKHDGRIWLTPFVAAGVTLRFLLEMTRGRLPGGKKVADCGLNAAVESEQG